MGKGPGRVERAIEAAFIAEPDNAFTVDDLCDRVYRGVNRIEKKHRVSVIRAAKSLCDRRPALNLNWLCSDRLGGALVFYTADNLMSYAMARLKSLGAYRSNDKRWERSVTEHDLRAQLSDDGDHYEYIVPGGIWWNYVELWKAERDGDTEKADVLRAEINRHLARLGFSPAYRDLGQDDDAA